LVVPATRLELTSCRLGDQGAVALGAALVENVCLQTLNLGGNNLGIRGARAIAAGLRFNVSLTSLDMSHNERLGDVGVASFGAALEENQTLENLDLSCTGAGKASALVISEALDSNPAGRLLRTSTRPTLCSDEPSPCACMCTHSGCKSCGRVRSRFECLV